MWIGSCSLKAAMQGMLIEWSPPSTTGKRPGGKDLAHAELDVGVALDRIGVDDVGVADVDHAHLSQEVGDVVLMVIGAGMAKGEQRGGLADGAGPEAGARAPLRAEVEGRADHGDIRVDRVPIEAERRFAEGADADERQVEAAGLVSVCDMAFLLARKLDRNTLLVKISFFHAFTMIFLSV